MIIKNKINLLFLIFFFLIIYLVSESFFCSNNGRYFNLNNSFNEYQFIHMSYLFLCDDGAPHNLNLWAEGNFVENLQSVFLFISIILLFLSIVKIRKKNLYVYYFLILQCLGLIYFLGEEISWGQHIFKWESSDIFLKHNIQNETNLHNISNLLNELPRSFVLIWCSFSAMAIVLARKFFKINELTFLIICPNKNLIYISLLLLFFVLPDLIIDKFNLHPGYEWFNLESLNEVISYMIDQKPPTINNHNLAIFYDQISFNFLRLSELHELIFSYYFFIYSLTLREKINS